MLQLILLGAVVNWIDRLLPPIEPSTRYIIKILVLHCVLFLFQSKWNCCKFVVDWVGSQCEIIQLQQFKSAPKLTNYNAINSTCAMCFALSNEQLSPFQFKWNSWDFVVDQVVFQVDMIQLQQVDLKHNLTKHNPVKRLQLNFLY